MSAVPASPAAPADDGRPKPVPGAARDRRLKLAALRVALLASLLAIWQVASLGAPPFVLPSPMRVWEAWTVLVASPTFWKDLGVTFERIVTGFALAAVFGVVVGLILGASKALGEFFEPVIPVMNTVSSAIWAIFAIIWFGVSNATTIFVVFMTAMPLIVTNVWQGTRTVNADFIELAHTLRMPQRKVMTKIYLPTILPYFFSGARLAFGFGWRVSLVAETLGASSGVGYRLRQAADLIQTDQVFAWTLALVVMMAALEMPACCGRSKIICSGGKRRPRRRDLSRPLIPDRGACTVKRIAVLAAAFAAALVAASAHAEKVRIGYWSSGVSLGFGAVLETGKFMEKQGLEVEYLKFPDVNAPTKALAAGAIDFAIGAPAAGAFSVAVDGLPLSIVLATQVAELDFVVPEDLPVKTMADLKGKKVGGSPAGSATAAITSAILATNYGVKAGEYEAVPGND